MADLNISWTNAMTIRFLELYAIERLLWDSTHKDYKTKSKIRLAWARISSQMNNIPVSYLKFKKKSLMATFRPLLKKKMASMKTAQGPDDVYQPIWFAYDQMESFLGNMYDEVDDSVYIEEVEAEEDQKCEIAMLPSPSTSTSEWPGNHSIWDTPAEPSDNTSIILSAGGQRQTRETDSFTSGGHKPRESDFTNDTQGRVNGSFESFNHRKERLETASRGLKRQAEDEDECELYAKLLAKRLRKYPEKSRDKIMYKIDGLLLDNPPDDYRTEDKASDNSTVPRENNKDP